MNVKIAIMAGVIMAGTAVLRAEESSNPAKEDYLSASQTKVSFRTIIWTNNLDFHEAENSFPTDGYTNGTSPEIIMEKGDMTMSNEYQIIAVYRNDEAAEFIEIDPEITAAAITNGSLPDLHDASEFYSWKYGTGHAANSGHIRRKPTQILIIEPLDPRQDLTPDRIRIQEYRFDATQAETAWYAWLNPRLFLLKWADYWRNGTGTTPVALMIITF